MNEQQRETLLTFLCLILGIACYVAVIPQWFLGLGCAIGAVALAFYHDRCFPPNPVVKVGMWLGLVFIGMLVLIGLFILGYFHLLQVKL